MLGKRKDNAFTIIYVLLTNTENIEERRRKKLLNGSCLHNIQTTRPVTSQSFSTLK